MDAKSNQICIFDQSTQFRTSKALFASKTHSHLTLSTKEKKVDVFIRLGNKNHKNYLMTKKLKN